MLIYAIGDIHGKHALLQNLLETLEAIPLHAEDRLLFLGDYIDRGEDVYGVIDTLLDLRDRRPDTLFLRGNHEQMMLDARDGPLPEPSPRSGFVIHSDPMNYWLRNGGADTLLSYEIDDYLTWWESIPETHWQFLRATQLEHLTPRYHFVHAGLMPPGETWVGAGTDLDPRLWIREPFLSSDTDFDGRIVVFGHSPQRTGKPLLLPNKIGLDTYAFGGGPLTAAAFNPNSTHDPLPPPRLYQVAATL